MKVALFSDAAAKRESFGLSRYVRALRAELRTREVAVETWAAKVEDPRSGVHAAPGGRKLLAASWALLGVPPLDWFAAADIVHATELDYPVATRKPLIVTVHDLGALTHPEYFKTAHAWLLRRALAHAARRADYVIAVSHATAQAVEDLTPVALGGRLKVIHSGIEEVFFERPDEVAPEPALAPEPYFLWVGTTSPRKNLVRVLEAFEAISGQTPHHLYLAGGAGWSSEAFTTRLAASPVAERIHQLGFVAEERLRALYRGATAFVYPSLMEGFGFPVLEAMASGCPVITSNTSSMPEIAGNAALLVDPLNVKHLAGAMLSAARQEALRSDLTRRGTVRARQFSWRRTVDHVMALYQEVLKT